MPITVKFKTGHLVHQKAQKPLDDWTECHIYIPDKENVTLAYRQPKAKISCDQCKRKQKT
jgi:hypothetical protein